MDLDGSWGNVKLAQSDDQGSLNGSITDEDNEVKTFSIRNYIPKKFIKKSLDLPQIIGIVIVFILIIIIIVLASIKNKNVTPINTSTEIILLDGNRFWTYDPQKGSLKLLLEVESPTQAFDIDASQTLYWIETNSWKIFSFHKSKNGTEKDINLFFEGTRTKPLVKPSMALDSINNNLYIVDESIRGLVIINADTKYYALMLIDLIKPRYIVLDTAKGLMFVSSTKWIKRADTDGNNLSTIVVNKTISAVTLDPEGEKIYWIHNSEVIESSDYSGHQEQQLLIDFTSIVDLAFLEGHLFWLRKTRGIQNKMIWSCKIQNGTCDNHTMHSNAVSTATFMRVTGRSENISRKQNPSNHQNCEHISLAAPNGQTSCVCNMSSQLVFKTKCEPITEFILYTFNGDVRARTLDISQKIVLEPIWPTPYFVETLKIKMNIDFDYDFERDDFYFSDDSKIYKMKLKEKHTQQEVVLISDSDKFFIKDLAFDWLTGNMYFLNVSKTTRNEHSIQVFNVKKGARVQKTLEYFYFYYDYYSINDQQFSYIQELSPCTLTVYPSRSVLFLTANIDYNNRFISQFTTNGTLISNFTKVSRPEFYHQDRLIAIDFEKDRLYWISSYFTISYSNFDDTDYTVINSNKKLHYVKAISINRQWIYLSDNENVWRVNKDTGSYDNLVSPAHGNVSIEAGARVISQSQIKINPCRVRNGGCVQFCYYGPKPTCDCADGLQVTSKGQCV